MRVWNCMCVRPGSWWPELELSYQLALVKDGDRPPGVHMATADQALVLLNSCAIYAPTPLGTLSTLQNA